MIDTISTQNGGGYSGQLIKNSVTNDYVLLDRGTVPSLSNLATDVGILLGPVANFFGLDFNSAQIASAQAYGKEVFTKLAQDMAAGDAVVGTLYLAGHSSGYAQTIKQYETLLDINQQIQADPMANTALKEASSLLLSKVRLFGVAGAGVPDSTLPPGSLDNIAVNLVLTGDIVDDAGKQYGINISLGGAGNGYGSVALGSAGAAALGATGLGIVAAGAAGGIAGNHPGAHTNAFFSKFQALASLTDQMLPGYSAGEIKALVAVDPFTWGAMSALDRSALLSDPVAAVADLQTNGLTPASIAQEAGGTRYTFATGASYLYHDTGSAKTYAFSPVDGNPGVTASVYSDRVEYLLPDNSTSTVYNTGGSQTTIGAFTYSRPAGNAQGTISAGGQTFAVPAGAAVSESGGSLLVQNSGSNGYPSLLVNPDGSATQFDYDASGNYLGSAQTGTGATGTPDNTRLDLTNSLDINGAPQWVTGSGSSAADGTNNRVLSDNFTSVADAIALGNTQTGTGLRGDALSGDSGADTLIGSNGNDILAGGAGADLLVAGAGGDYIFGDTDWAAGPGRDWGVIANVLVGGAGGIALWAGDTRDVLYAGAGDDRAWGDLGNDVLFGENGDDLLVGGDGSDVILGGDNNDTIYGDLDIIAAEPGSDYLDGGAGSDTIYGNEGGDILIGGADNDTLYGGAGQDTYLYNLGDGIDTIYDTRADNNSLRFGAGVDKNNIKLRLGSLRLDLGNGEEVHIDNFDQNDALNSATIQRFEFDDGSTLTSNELLA
ncbi:MAG: hypothetical protein HZC43_11380, partial [Nitrosomonadales bacterium]|nr:hypothetical protein [Nitrosomonadales bacterium]